MSWNKNLMTGKKYLFQSVLLFLGSLPVVSVAADYNFGLRSQNLGDALKQFSEQSGAQIVFSSKIVEGIKGQRLEGKYDIDSGLRILLQGTGLYHTINSEGVIIISARAGDRARAGQALLLTEYNTPGQKQILQNAEGQASEDKVSEKIELPKSEMEFEEIVISASRIQKSGYESPTPVTILGADMMESRGVTNVANIINEIPAFTPSQTPSTTLTSRGNGVNGLNIRGLGTNRNLVLVNGRRHVPTDEFGTVDINVLPSAAIKRVEVVTGGASAAWGSDAVSGVVNIIYDKTLDGIKSEIQYGASGKGDADDYRFSFAYGGDIHDGRGHVLLSAEYNKNKGIPLATARGWSNRHPGILGNPDDTGANDGIPRLRFADDVSLFLATPNGVTLPGGPLGNIEFLPDGTTRPRVLGEVGGVLMAGGNGSFLQDTSSIVVPVERKNILVAIDYEINNKTSMFFEGTISQSQSFGALIDSFSFGVPIMADNAYLPADVRQIMNDNDIDSFDLYRTNSEFGPISSDSENNNYRIVGGLKGAFDNDWYWDTYYQFGESNFTNVQVNNLVPGRLSLAANAVVDESTGNIVCAAALSGNDSDCVPINLFGIGSPGQSAIEYVTGESFSRTRLQQQVFALTVGGDLFEGWSGPISTSFGVEYREEKLERNVDELSDQGAYLITNAQPLSGSYDVKEVFGEVLVPLLDNIRFFRALDFNGAVRMTDYSTSGSVVAWKGGLAWELVEDLKFRGTVSRDIRAPAIGEVFLETLLLFDNLDNPFTGNVDFSRIANTGNSDLQEEQATTVTFGAIYSPSWLEGLQVSADWYDIDIENTISQITSQEIVNRCFSGAEEFCDLISFTPENSITEVANKLLNLGTFQIQGIDFDARYSMLLGNGQLDFSLLGSYVKSKMVAPDGLAANEFAGELLADGNGLPRLKLRGSATYTAGSLGLFAQVRYIGSGKYVNAFGPEDLSESDNNIGAEWYMDMSARYAIDNGSASGWEVFAGVNNVFDREPPVIPRNFISPTPTNPAFYDVIGRYFYTGIRKNF